jgi:hypothetical protein
LWIAVFNIERPVAEAPFFRRGARTAEIVPFSRGC